MQKKKTAENLVFYFIFLFYCYPLFWKIR